MTMTRVKYALLAAGAASLAIGMGALSASCSQTPTNIPVRTFEIAQRMDVVCMLVNDPSGNALPGPPQPVPEDQCAQVGINVNGAALQYHLYAAVTQLGRGELAVVDLTAGWVVDEDRSTPGINFIPVGLIPTDVTVAPDAQMTFVASADPSKPAIYGIPNSRLLGDETGTQADGKPQAPLQLTDLLACSLPQPPKALTVAPTASGGYVLIAMLDGSSGSTAKIAAFDPGPLLAGAHIGSGSDAGVTPGTLTPCAFVGGTELSPSLPSSWSQGPTWPDGVPYSDGGIDPDAEPSPGPSCSGLSGPPDGGLPLPMVFGSLAEPHPKAMAMRDDVPLLYVSDDALPLIHVIDLSDPTNPREQAPLLATSVVAPQRRVAVGALAISPPTHDYKRYLYAVDASDVVASVMVFDVTDPVASPRVPMERPHPELNPFTPPDRLAFSAPVATLAFVQHDWPLADPSQPTNPVHQYSGLLCNPNPNAYPAPNTFLDRGAYYRADQAGLIQPSGSVSNFPYRLRGVFAFLTLSNGTVVTVDVDDWDAPCRRPDPMASAGASVVDPHDPSTSFSALGMTGALDQPETAASSASDLDPYHAPFSYDTGQLDENSGTTIEAFFPVSAPNRMRSNFLLRNDPTTGNHVPTLTAPAQLFDVNGALVATNSTGSASAPLLLPAPLSPGFADVTYQQNPTEPNPNSRTASSPDLLSYTKQLADAKTSALVPGSSTTTSAGVRISFDDPTAHIDQDWTVTYEGALPSVANISLDLSSYDGYQTLTLATGRLPVDEADAGAEGGDGGGDATVEASSTASTFPSPGFCARGVEDWDMGKARALAVTGALNAAGLPAPGAGASASANSPTLDQWTSDYVELVDDVLPEGDPYWGIPSSDEQDCWNDIGLEDPDGTAAPSPYASQRYDLCASTFGADGEDAAPNGGGTVADLNYARDLPIIQAYDDHLVLGRFGWFTTDANGAAVQEQTTNRVIVGPDASNVPFLERVRCCFHHQAAFKVRTGGEWLTVGSTSGMLHHVQTDPATNRCVSTCNQADVLKNSRAFDIPWGTPPACTSPGLPPGIDRNSPLAMRNPMFSFVQWGGCAPLVGNDHTETARDLVWKFSILDGFQPVTVSLSQNTTTAVSPAVDAVHRLARAARRGRQRAAGPRHHRPQHAPVRARALLLIRERPMSRASQTPVMRQYLAAKAAHPDALALLPHGRLLRALLRGRGRRGARARPHADGAQQGLGRRDPDGRRAAPRGELVRPAAPRAGVQGRDLRADGRSRRRSRGSCRARWCASSRRGIAYDDAGLEAREEPLLVAAVERDAAGALRRRGARPVDRRALGVRGRRRSDGARRSSCASTRARCSLETAAQPVAAALAHGAPARRASARWPMPLSAGDADALLDAQLGAGEAQASCPLGRRRAAPRRGVVAAARACEAGPTAAGRRGSSSTSSATRCVLDDATQAHLELVRSVDGDDAWLAPRRRST